MEKERYIQLFILKVSDYFSKSALTILNVQWYFGRDFVDGNEVDIFVDNILGSAIKSAIIDNYQLFTKNYKLKCLIDDNYEYNSIELEVAYDKLIKYLNCIFMYEIDGIEYKIIQDVKAKEKFYDEFPLTDLIDFEDFAFAVVSEIINYFNFLNGKDKKISLNQMIPANDNKI